MAKATKNKISAMVDMPTPSTSYKPSAKEMVERRRYEVQDALRTITRAEEIRRDRGMMAEVKKCAREQVKSLECVTKKR